MIDSASLLPFVLASLALLLAPGPAVLYIVTRSIDQGRMAGIVSVFGIGLGGLVHVLGAALGLSALLASSALAFTIVKYLGAAYLVYLGLRTLLAETESVSAARPARQPLNRVFRQGVIVNVLNPKTALFFLAFLPQFADPARGPVTLQIALLGLLFVTMAICTDGAYALLAGTLGDWLRNSRTFLNVRKYLSGSVYILLGLTTAFGGSHSE